ncbi:L-threonylcarbamoyladenylate synthase [Aquisphaera insulae]|uniref:L-threonylcarbamoyladenylate synthase n=1 Tax=Aquisphaera insulae TaxID=2712864 RepID=UPI0013EA2952|nr:L-threonylcarbamoyladenylate synthase [Aquisphaera insulae]
MIRIDPDRPDPEIVAEAAAILRLGGLVAFATETVYGLGAVATEPAAVGRIFEAKGRPSFNPLIVHVDGVERARECAASWPDAADRLAARFWPGPLTLVLPRSARIPDEVTAGRSTVAIRSPATAVARALIAAVGLPLAAPSANRSNRISPTRAEHVLEELDGRVELILDSGPTRLGLESTVLDLTSSTPVILRPGPIGLAEIRSVLEQVPVVEAGEGSHSDSPASPGMLPVHYAPRTPAYRLEPGDGIPARSWTARSALLILGSHGAEQWPDSLPRIILSHPIAAARDLYATLRELDSRGLGAIFVAMPPAVAEWAAVRDRLLRATRPLVEQPPLDVDD